MKKNLLLLIILFAARLAIAQTAATNTGILYITGSADIFCAASDFTNNSGSSLSNYGQLHIKGTLTNNQSLMIVGTGTLYLIGSSAQAVNGAQPFKTFNLTTNNSSGITINNNLSVSGTHTFTSGLIATSATPNYLIYEAGSSYTGDGDTRHVNGWVKKFGSTNFIFPVGSAAYERTVAITNLSLSAEMNCRYFTSTQNVINLTSPLVQVEDRESWQIDKISGGTAQITLNWDNSKVALHNVLLGDIVVAHYTAASWTSIGTTATGDPHTTGTVISSAVSTIGPLTFGFKSFPVPLKLISFTAERGAGVSFLHWITVDEQNVSHFEIQRSNDAYVYTTIGTVPARNLPYQQYYDFEDHLPLQGIVYYRIKSVDIDGKFTYSRIVLLSDKEFGSGSFLVLNPVHTVITVFNRTGKDGLFDYRLFTAGGQLVLSGNIKMPVNGNAVLPLPSQTAGGIYVLQLSNVNTNFSQKILVER